jgi:hypothetical protein
VAGHSGGSGHGWTHKVRATTKALSTLKISITGAGAAIARCQFVSIHGQTHGATGLAPLHTRLQKDGVQSLLLSLCFDQPRTGHYQRLLNTLGNTLAFDNRRGCSHILNARIGT